jgi:DNA-directed RNA polymerase specialized sigma24 family protein
MGTVREADAASLAAGSTSSMLVFGGIAVVVTGAVFGGPYLETRRRSASVRRATLNPPSAPDAGYEELFAAAQRRAYQIAALMTGNAERATATAEEAFNRTLQQWTRLPADGRVWFVLSTVVKLCLGDSFLASLGRPVGSVAGSLEPELVRAARALSTLEPERRAMVILARSERMSVAEVAAVMDTDPTRVASELEAGLEQLGPILATVAA